MASRRGGLSLGGHKKPANITPKMTKMLSRRYKKAWTLYKFS